MLLPRAPLFLLPFISTLALAAPFCKLSSSSSATAAGPTSTSTSGNGTTNGNGTSDLVAAAWYPNWLGLTPSNISWSKYTMVTYAFGLTTADPSVISIEDSNDLTEFVTAAHANNVDALISIGGWSGSIYFSSAVGSAENRTTFVNAIVKLVKDYDLDGIDFDWEYPNKQGIGCNIISSDDAANYLSFLQELRADDTGKDIYISGAVSITPFVGSDGTPMTDVSDFADVFDHIAIMAYDISGSWSATVGPNAPLNDTCATTKTGSAVSGVDAWTAAGMPAEQIVLGVAAYGRGFTVTALNGFTSGDTLTSFPAFTGIPKGDSLDAPYTDTCGVTSPLSGVSRFVGLIEDGFLTSNGTAAEGIDYFFDDCSQTPFVYKSSTQVMVSYDDATSFQAKGNYITKTGLKGFAMWHIAGDSNDILLDAINSALDA